MITRHFVDVRDPSGFVRRVHYRRSGSGPPVVLIHQSPRSSAEHLEKLRDWAGDFTLYAPDTPGFGDSQPLDHTNPETENYADAVLAFMNAVGLAQTGAYGMHSGAITLITAAKRAPDRFTAIAANGYAVWTEAEKADFAANYTPPFLPMPYGEHLAWLWGRLLEQTWFFPWYRATPATRMAMATGDPLKIDPLVMEVLAAGDTFRLGYAAVLRANRDMPEAGAPTPPVLLTAYDGDPLKAHLARMGEIPSNWEIRPLTTPAEVDAACRAWLLASPAPVARLPADRDDAGFVHVVAAGFDGMIHWQGPRDAAAVVLHAPGSAAVVAARDGVLAIDLPGHGLSDDWSVPPPGLDGWRAVVAATRAALGVAADVPAEGFGLSAALAGAPAAPRGNLADWRAHGLPDLAPDRYGAYLQRAWQCVRAQTIFDPWFAPAAASAIDFDPADLDPAALAVRHRALLQARSGRLLLDHILDTLEGTS